MNMQTTMDRLTIRNKPVHVYEQYYGNRITLQFEVDGEWAGTIPNRLSQNRNGERDRYIAETIKMNE